MKKKRDHQILRFFIKFLRIFTRLVFLLRISRIRTNCFSAHPPRNATMLWNVGPRLGVAAGRQIVITHWWNYLNNSRGDLLMATTPKGRSFE